MRPGSVKKRFAVHERTSLSSALSSSLPNIGASSRKPEVWLSSWCAVSWAIFGCRSFT
jgi:hypothetical protein